LWDHFTFNIEVAFITATWHSFKKWLLIIDIKSQETIVELIEKTTYICATGLKVRVDIFIKEMYSTLKNKVISGEFTFVAIDEKIKAVKVV
jgi:hypothetical protein